LPNDPLIVDMDPVLKIWMFYHWIEDQKEKIDITKNHAYLLGSFINPEAVKEMLRDDNKFESSEEDFEKSWQLVQNNSVNINELLGNKGSKENQPSIKRRKRTLKE
jgi:hypothetical protein